MGHSTYHGCLGVSKSLCAKASPLGFGIRQIGEKMRACMYPLSDRVGEFPTLPVSGSLKNCLRGARIMSEKKEKKKKKKKKQKGKKSEKNNKKSGNK